MEHVIIDFEKYRTPGAKVFIGRDRGATVRTESKVDELASQHERITIRIPKDIRSINPSFLEEFFYHLIPLLGKDKFLKKFNFINADRYKTEDDLNEAIDRILRKENALA